MKKELHGISTLRFGSEYWYAVNNNKYNDTISKLVDNYQSVFAETELHITNDLAAQIGGRFEHSSLLEKIKFCTAYIIGI